MMIVTEKQHGIKCGHVYISERVYMTNSLGPTTLRIGQWECHCTFTTQTLAMDLEPPCERGPRLPNFPSRQCFWSLYVEHLL